MEKVSKR